MSSSGGKTNESDLDSSWAQLLNYHEALDDFTDE